MTSPSDTVGHCACCGALLREGRVYTCNDRCEAAQNEDIERYFRAAKEHRHDFELGYNMDGTVKGGTGSWVDHAVADSLAVLRAGTGGVPDYWRRR